MGRVHCSLEWFPVFSLSVSATVLFYSALLLRFFEITKRPSPLEYKCRLSSLKLSSIRHQEIYARYILTQKNTYYSVTANSLYGQWPHIRDCKNKGKKTPDVTQAASNSAARESLAIGSHLYFVIPVSLIPGFNSQFTGLVANGTRFNTDWAVKYSNRASPERLLSRLPWGPSAVCSYR